MPAKVTAIRAKPAPRNDNALLEDQRWKLFEVQAMVRSVERYLNEKSLGEADEECTLLVLGAAVRMLGDVTAALERPIASSTEPGAQP